MIDSKGRTYIKIYCCGDCVQYNWRTHRCGLGAHVNGNADDCFYLDCPFLKEEKKQTWIPVTERYPLPWELVWVTDKRGQVNVCQMSHKDNQYWYDSEEEWMYEHDAIVAWMPYYVPEPYQEADHE